MPRAPKSSSKRRPAPSSRAVAVARTKAKPGPKPKLKAKPAASKSSAASRKSKPASSKSKPSGRSAKSASSKSSPSGRSAKSTSSKISTSELLALLAAAAKKSSATPAPPKAQSKADASYAHYLKLAMALPKDEVVPYRLDPQLALYNVKFGLASLEGSWAQLKKALPLLNFELLEDLPALCQAVIAASTQVVGPERSDGEVSALMAEARTLRSLLLSTASALALPGHLPAAAVDKIRAGVGFIDMARDCIELALLYKKHPASLTQQQLVSMTELDRAAEVGAELLERLKPMGSHKTPAPGESTATVERNRLASLLVACHRDLRRAGYWLWADQVDAHVPYLQARKVVRGKPKPAPATPPIPPPTNP